MKENQYSFIKILFILSILVYVIFGLKDRQNFFLIYGVNLIFHEFGHFFFMFGGEMLHFFGGTIMQLLIPSVIFFYFLSKKSFYSSSVVLSWIAINFFDISFYVKDARAQSLPLLIPGSTHDWNHILGVFNLLRYDQIIGNTILSFGIVIFIASIISGFYFSKKIYD